MVYLADVNLVAPKAGAKQEFWFNKPPQFVECINRTKAAQQSVTKIISVTNSNMATPKAGANCKP
jgi:hypothetical protein